jgi:polyisoprenoid-binding protein YceI
MSNVVEGQPNVSTWAVDPAHSSVEFAVKHMVITTVRGRFAKSTVDLDLREESPLLSRVQAKIEAASIDTRESKRDEHLRSADFFDAEKFPYLTFNSKRVEEAGKGKYRVVGDLTIKDVTREVVLDTTFSGVAKSPWGMQVAGFSAETTINRTDWGLTWNAALETGGVLVSDEVKISIEVEAIKQG